MTLGQQNPKIGQRVIRQRSQSQRAVEWLPLLDDLRVQLERRWDFYSATLRIEPAPSVKRLHIKLHSFCGLCRFPFFDQFHNITDISTAAPGTRIGV